MAKSVSKTATASTAFGEPIPQTSPSGVVLNGEVKFGYDYIEVESQEEIPADEQPTQKQILNLVNSLRNATARNKAQAIAFEAAGLKAPSVDPAESRRRMLIKVMVAEGATTEVAEQMADTMLKNFRG